MNVCGACGLDFGSLQAFDLHRVGRHEPLGRRCLSVDELERKGFVLNAHGRWTTQASIDRGRTRGRTTAQAAI